MNELKEKKFRDHIWAYQNYFIVAAILVGFNLFYLMFESNMDKFIAIVSQTAPFCVLIAGYRYNKKFINEN